MNIRTTIYDTFSKYNQLKVIFRIFLSPHHKRMINTLTVKIFNVK